MLQKNYVSNIFASIKEAEEGSHIVAILFGSSAILEALPVTTGSDVGSFLALHLEKLRAEIIAAIPSTTDKDSKEHLEYIAQSIKDGLANRFK
jgi:hypothetical protein